MRLLAYTLAIAGAALLGQTIAAPVETRGDVAQHVEEQRLERREDMTEEQREALKYFHEPGYVCHRVKRAAVAITRDRCPSIVQGLVGVD